MKVEKIQIDIEKQKVIEDKLLLTYHYKNNTIPFLVYSMNYLVDGENPVIISNKTPEPYKDGLMPWENLMALKDAAREHSESLR